LQWIEFPLGTQTDPTSGATDRPGATKSVTTKAFLHAVKVTGTMRIYAEIQEGMKILDLITPLVRITDSGDTDLSVGEVVDENEFRMNQREAAASGFSQPSSVPVNIIEFKGVSVIVDGERWVQQEVGQKLAQMWDAVFAGFRFSQTLLLKRST
jgi:hypothetical protein